MDREAKTRKKEFPASAIHGVRSGETNTKSSGANGKTVNLTTNSIAPSRRKRPRARNSRNTNHPHDAAEGWEKPKRSKNDKRELRAPMKSGECEERRPKTSNRAQRRSASDRRENRQDVGGGGGERISINRCWTWDRKVVSVRDILQPVGSWEKQKGQQFEVEGHNLLGRWDSYREKKGV